MNKVTSKGEFAPTNQYVILRCEFDGIQMNCNKEYNNWWGKIFLLHFLDFEDNPLRFELVSWRKAQLVLHHEDCCRTVKHQSFLVSNQVRMVECH